MSKAISCALVLCAAFLATSPSAAAGAGVAAAQQAAGPVSAADAAPFLGDWTLALEGPNGPGKFTLSVKMEKEKPAAELVTEAMGTPVITDIAKADKALLLSYSFLYENNPVDAVVRLTPAPEGKMNAQIDFAGGAYVMSGTATKKENK
jgi:hypothetical protein